MCASVLNNTSLCSLGGKQCLSTINHCSVQKVFLSSTTVVENLKIICSVAKWKRNVDNRQVGFDLTTRCCGIQSQFTVGNTWAWPDSPHKEGGGKRRKQGHCPYCVIDPTLTYQHSSSCRFSNVNGCVLFEISGTHAASDQPRPDSVPCRGTNHKQVCGPAEWTKPQGSCPGKNPEGKGRN